MLTAELDFRKSELSPDFLVYMGKSILPTTLSALPPFLTTVRWTVLVHFSSHDSEACIISETMTDQCPLTSRCMELVSGGRGLSDALI